MVVYGKEIKGEYMQRILIILSFVWVVFLGVSCSGAGAGGGGDNPDNPNGSDYTVTLDYNYIGGIKTATVVSSGEILSRPKTPTRNGYDFSGWYLDKDCTEEYDFQDSVVQNFTLYAKWDDAITLSMSSDSYLFTIEGVTDKLFGPISVNGLSSYKTYTKNGYSLIISVIDHTGPNTRQTTVKVRYPDTTSYVNGAITYKASQYIDYYLVAAGVKFEKSGSYLSIARSASDVGVNSDGAIDNNYQNDFSATQFFEAQGFGTVMISAYGKRSITVQGAGKFPSGVYVLE